MGSILAKIWRWLCLSGLAILWVLTVAFPNFSRAYITSDMGDGLIELSTNTDQGFMVTELTHKTITSTGKKWVYFCVSENSKTSQRCFYGLEHEFRNVKEGMKIIGLQYELKDRIYNNKKLISVGKGRYFYAVKIVRPAA